MRTKVTLSDVVLSLAVLAAACLLWFLPLRLSSGTAEVVLITVAEGETIRMSLEKDAEREICAREVHLTVAVADGKVYVSRSDCENGLCVATPPISRVGQTIVCAPAGVVIRIEGKEAPDGIVG